MGSEDMENAPKGKTDPNVVYNPEKTGLNEDDLLSLIAIIIAEVILNEDNEH